MKLKFQQSLSSANGLTDLEIKTIEAFKFLFLNDDSQEGIKIQSPVFVNISGVPEFTIIEKEDGMTYTNPLVATLLTANSDLVNAWFEKDNQLSALESTEAMQHQIKYKGGDVHFAVLNTKVAKGDRYTLYLTNTFCVKFRSGRFADTSFFLMIKFEINFSSNTIPNFHVCLSKLKTVQLFDASGLLMLE